MRVLQLNFNKNVHPMLVKLEFLLFVAFYNYLKAIMTDQDELKICKNFSHTMVGHEWSRWFECENLVADELLVVVGGGVVRHTIVLIKEKGDDFQQPVSHL